MHNSCGIDTGSDYLNNLLNNSKQLPNNKGKARCFEAAGGWDNLLKDFSNLNLSNLRDISTQYGAGKLGFLENGVKVVARQGSKSAGSKLEVFLTNSRVIIIRY